MAREVSTQLLSSVDRSISSREQLTGLADRLLNGARRWASPNFARITPPGAEGGYGTAVDGLEGFARTFLLAGFRIVGEGGVGVDTLIADYTRGIIAGVDPSAEDRWIRITEHPQAKVEAASIALILDMTRPWIWDRLDELTRSRVIDYLSPVVGDDTYPQTNWVWFRLVVQTFLRSVGGPWSADDVAADLARHDSFARADGWMADGAERSFDHYVGWALHVYPILWSRMDGAAELSNGRTSRDIAALGRFLEDAVALIGGDGSPLIQGRSLIYRFAAAAPFWAGVLAGVPNIPMGQLRHAATAIVDHFATRGVPDDEDLLTLGWHHSWRPLAQSYSGPGSPYWASKGLLGIALPADHPVWAEQDVALPIERGDFVRAITAPGWIVAGTADDGIVRVLNHGTDHALEGDLVGDSPLYARLGYSTATSPLLDTSGWRHPLEQSVSLIDEQGRPTHRAGMTLLGAWTVEGTAVAGSVCAAHWIEADPTQHGHGSGVSGIAVPAGEITIWSLARGAWEVRFVRVRNLAPDTKVTALRIGGWPVTGSDPIMKVTDQVAAVRSDTLRSTVITLEPLAKTKVSTRTNATPLGPWSGIPVIELPVAEDTVTCLLIELTGTSPNLDPADERNDAPSVRMDEDTFQITWPDGTLTNGTFQDSRIAMVAIG